MTFSPDPTLHKLAVEALCKVEKARNEALMSVRSLRCEAQEVFIEDRKSMPELIDLDNAINELINRRDMMVNALKRAAYRDANDKADEADAFQSTIGCLRHVILRSQD